LKERPNITPYELLKEQKKYFTVFEAAAELIANEHQAKLNSRFKRDIVKSVAVNSEYPIDIQLRIVEQLIDKNMWYFKAQMQNQ